MDKKIKAALLAALIASFVLASSGCRNQDRRDIPELPVLPRPIAKEPVLITSAGQSTDTYIVKDVANQLMLHNFFMPQAGEANLKDTNTIVFVVGYSPMGEKLHELSFDDEKKRITKLLDNLNDKNMTVLTIFIGGKQRRDQKTNELLKLICPKSHYIIGTREADFDNLLRDIANKNNIPLTLVRNINDVSEPFASAFR